MNKFRLESISDAFFAVIMTIMVLELKPPQGTSFSSLAPLDPKFLSYVLSFLFLGIFWHYHNLIFQATKSVNGSIVFANLVFLFCVSLIPFSLSWIGADGFSTTAVILYGTVLLFSSLSFLLILKLLLK
ncbi:MAG: TMEM175 family protein, partial [Bacteriovoracales bacterium]